jgi:AraC family transcriptional regulator, arabinose operon regulatory protein
MPVRPISDGIDRRVQKVSQILRRDFNQRINVADLARDIGLSTSRLQHLFRKQTGQTIKGTLKRIRLENAIRLLDDPGLSIKEISFMVGYCCTQDFCRDLKNRCGYTPSVFRSRRPDASPQVNNVGRINCR